MLWGGRDLRRPSSPNPRSEQGHQLDQGAQSPPNLAWDVPRDGASTASLGNLCQGLTTLIVKNFFLIATLNLPSLSLKPLPLVLSQQALQKSFPSFLVIPLQALAAALRSPCSLLLPRLPSPSSPSLSSQQRGSSPRIIWSRAITHICPLHFPSEAGDTGDVGTARHGSLQPPARFHPAETCCSRRC